MRDRSPEAQRYFAPFDEAMKKIEDKDLVSRHKPTIIGCGAEHAVFAFPDHPNLVGKVNYRLLADQITASAERDPTEFLKERRDDNRRAYLVLKKYFGERVVREREAIVVVPVTDELIAHLKNVDFNADTIRVRELPTLVRFQEKVELEKRGDGGALGVPQGYIERIFDPENPDHVEIYEHTLSQMIDGTDSEDPALFSYFLGDKFNTLQRKALQEPGLRDVLFDFFDRATRYSYETGEILDLAGTDNVTFYKENGEWTYRLIDALYPGELLDGVDTSLGDLNHEIELDQHETYDLFNAIAYVRTLNAIALIAQTDERYAPFAIETKPHAKKLLDMLSQL